MSVLLTMVPMGSSVCRLTAEDMWFCRFGQCTVSEKGGKDNPLLDLCFSFGYLISHGSDWSRSFVGIITHHAFFLDFESLYQDISVLHESSDNSIYLLSFF